MNTYLATTLLAATWFLIGVASGPAWRWALAERARLGFRPLRPWQERMMIGALGYAVVVALFNLTVGVMYDPVHWPNLETEAISSVGTITSMLAVLAAVAILRFTGGGPGPDDPDLFV